MFNGEYRHTVDEKGRIAVPSRFRAPLTGGAFVTRWVDACGAIFPPEDWEALMKKVKTLPIGDPSARSFQRFISASAYPLELDRQGRFVLPATVREWAGLTGEVVVVGSQDHLELWEPGRWSEYVALMASSPEVVAQHLQNLGI